MRLFLDAHISARAVARELRGRGHDVRAADEERRLDGLDHESLLELAVADGRILVTHNVRDFARIAAEWAVEGRHHGGCVCLVRIDHREFGTILRVIEGVLSVRPDQSAWVDHVAWGTRTSGG